MEPLSDQLELWFHGTALAISARRLWEHTELGQINPFEPVAPASAAQPQAFVDVVDESETLTGLTLADLWAGSRGNLSEIAARELLRDLQSDTARRWLADIAAHLQRVSQRRALRNSPARFLPADAASPLGVKGLDCALPAWLRLYRNEQASPAEWLRRLRNLSNKGLREEEVALSAVSDRLQEFEEGVISADALLGCVSYATLHLSVVPVTYPVTAQLKFVRVPPNSPSNRIKPKIKAGPTLRPQWRDRVLGYWIDLVEWTDLLGPQRGWMAFTHRGQPIVSGDRPSGFCGAPDQAVELANNHAKALFPKLTARGQWTRYRITGGERYREWLVTLPYYPRTFSSSHFAHRNVLLHVRCDIRAGPDGERVLVLHEVQSDWAQQARRIGDPEERIAAALPVPPWLHEWPALALKLMLLHAAHLDADAMAWTVGETQLERYGGLGGVGLRDLYNRTLPAEANRLLRAHRRKCESIDTYQPVNFYIEPAEIGYEVFDDARQSIGKAATWEEAQALLPDGAQELLTPMHGIRLDADLRRKVLATGFYGWGGGIRQ